jgi:hypothetical protein
MTWTAPLSSTSVSMVRIISISSSSPRPEEHALARVSKDGRKRDRARGHPSRRPREERGLLRMRSEALNSIVRCDWFLGIDLLDVLAYPICRRLPGGILTQAMACGLAPSRHGNAVAAASPPPSMRKPSLSRTDLNVGWLERSVKPGQLRRGKRLEK